MSTTVVSPADHCSINSMSEKSEVRSLDVTVLMGGPSSERDVSLQSGRAVASAMERLGHQVRCADVSPDHLLCLDEPADLVFIALHGAFGEDGQLQSILEERGLAFTGSGSAASALAMNKAAAKGRFVESGIPTPAFEVVTAAQVNRVLKCWRLPVIIKPIDQGSSVDTTIAKDAFGFQAALERVVDKYGSCLIEEYIRGPELTVGILGDLALPVCQIKTPREFYDYTAKYLVDTTQYIFDVPLPPVLLKDIQRMSLEAHRALGCRDFSRIDWMVDAQTQQPYILEVNTIPGFTDHSLLPKAAARIGIDFDGLCQKMIDMAVQRV